MQRRQGYVCPRFTYHGFRYVSIAGMGGNPPLDAFTALVLGTDAAATAQFSCSSPLVNRLWANIVWGQRSNFVDVPTDCPQRDERLGWTGDAAVFCRTAAQNEDVYRFFRKWLADLAIGQAADGGKAAHRAERERTGQRRRCRLV